MVDDDLVLNIREALDEQGAEVTLISITLGSYNPSTASAAANTDDVQQDTIGVFLSYNEDDIDGTKIQANDTRLILAADLDPAPKIDDLILRARDEATFKIVAVKKYEVSDSPVAHVCQVRNAGPNF